VRAGARGLAPGLWQRLLRTGIHDELDARQAQRVGAANAVALTVAIALACYAPVFLYLGDVFVGWSCGGIGLVSLVVLPLQSARRYWAAAILLVVLTNLAVLGYASSMGPGAMIEVAFVFTACIPWFFCDPRRRPTVALSAISPVGMVLLSAGAVDWVPPTPFDPETLLVLRTAIVVTCTTTVAVAVRWFAVNSARAEEHLEGTVVRLQNEAAERKRAMRDLERASGEISELSREAGRAEIAAGVLHNVGNVLNVLNLARCRLEEVVHKPTLEKLKRGLAVLREQQDGDPGFLGTSRGGKVCAYLDEVTGALSRERGGEAEDVRTIVETVSHIREVIAAQQTFARRRSVAEVVGVQELLDQILVLGRHRIPPETRVDVRVAVEGTVVCDRHQVTSVLTNLVINAGDAMVEAAHPLLSVHIRADGEMLVFSVADTGVGIAPEARDRIFQHGFTTKANGHGFGLHSAASIATALGGSLSMQSDGPGKGACFTLSIPFARPVALAS
jgi:signal transduction histidine kinase